MERKLLPALFVGVLLTVLHVSEAARRVDAHLRARETMRMRRARTEFYKRDGLQGYQEPDLDVKELLQLTEGEELELTRTTSNVQGTNIERLEETYNGLPVFDSVVTVRTNQDGQLTGDASGQLVQDIADDLSDLNPKLTDDELLEIVLQAEGDSSRSYKIGDEQVKRIIYVDDDNVAHLAGLVSYLIDGEKRPKYVVDANSGKVLRHWQDFHTFNCGERTYKAYGGNTKIGKIKYGDSPYCLNMTEESGTCYLENKYVRVVDMKNSRDEGVTETASFPCKNGYDDEVNGAYSPIVDAFFYGTIVAKMFEDWFDSTPLESQIVLRVHYGTSYENAFWNGVNCTFGDGQTTFYPMTSLDILGHEVGHGVTEQASGLIYSDESGGINEAFSDILGEASEKYMLDNDMLVGYAVDKEGQGLREFENPTSDGQSIDKVSQMESYTDPHYSSGIYRRIFYVVVEQKQVPIRHATQVFLHANRMYWRPSSTFFDASCGTLKAAMDLGFSATPYKRAFADVGLQPCDVDTHIFALTSGRAQSNVIVSSEIKPIFQFEVTEYGNPISISATSDNGRVGIKVQRHEWLEDDLGNPTNVIASGTTNVVIDEGETFTYYFQVESEDGREHRDVNVLVSF